MKEVIFNFLAKQSRPITFDQLMTALPEGQGQRSFGSARSNLIYWVGMSESMATALLELIEDDIVEIEPCSSDVYLVAGNYPDYPLANGYHPYESFHWLPVVLSAVKILEVH